MAFFWVKLDAKNIAASYGADKFIAIDTRGGQMRIVLQHHMVRVCEIEFIAFLQTMKKR